MGYRGIYRFFVFVLLVLTATAGTRTAACAQAPKNGDAAVIQIRGSITAMPVVRSMAEAFMKGNPGSIVTVEGGPSVQGTKALLDGAVDLAMISHVVTREEERRAVKIDRSLSVYKFAFDTIGLLVHPKNPLRTLTMDQVRDIYIGRITSWKELKGADQPITIFAHGPLSGTHEAWQNVVMGKLAVTSSAKVMTSAEVQENLARSPWAIAYLAREQIDQRFKQLTLETVTMKDGKPVHAPFIVRRELALAALEPAGPAVHAFMDFVRGPEGQALIKAHNMQSTAPGAKR
ncbi:MAG: phosphate binding protein [Rhodospirillales bacterium]|jgi:phosphate transport system substrate-binding protein|nr:phosphate binding protein [Rhodospirillales bacterium]